MKQEIEMALQLLEKDIHEKQDSIIGLRKQLEEVKTINLQMYEKLEVRRVCSQCVMCLVWRSF